MKMSNTDEFATVNGKPDKWERRMRILQPIILALIGLATVYYGNKSSDAAAAARNQTAEVAKAVDSTAIERGEQLDRLQATADTTHLIVNSRRDKLERDNILLRRALNAARDSIREVQ